MLSWAVLKEVQAVFAATFSSKSLPLALLDVLPEEVVAVPPIRVPVLLVLWLNVLPVLTWCSAVRIPMLWPSAVVLTVSTPNVVTVWYVRE